MAELLWCRTCQNLVAGGVVVMQKGAVPCKYCEESGSVNDEGTCGLCKPIEPMVDRGLEGGRLPTLSVHDFGPIEGASTATGYRCAVCGAEIADRAEHPVYRSYRNPRIQFRGDLHFHSRCGAIWRIRATHG